MTDGPGLPGIHASARDTGTAESGAIWPSARSGRNRHHGDDVRRASWTGLAAGIPRGVRGRCSGWSLRQRAAGRWARRCAPATAPRPYGRARQRASLLRRTDPDTRRCGWSGHGRGPTGHSLGGHVTALAREPHAEALRELGADEVLDYTKTSTSRSVDVILETVGTELNCHRGRPGKGGRMVTVGLCASALAAFAGSGPLRRTSTPSTRSPRSPPRTSRSSAAAPWASMWWP